MLSECILFGGCQNITSLLLKNGLQILGSEFREGRRVVR